MLPWAQAIYRFPSVDRARGMSCGPASCVHDWVDRCRASGGALREPDFGNYSSGPHPWRRSPRGLWSLSQERGAGRAHQAQVGTGQAWKAPGYVPPWGPSLVVNQHRSTNFRKKIQMTTLLALVAAAVLALQAGHGVGGCGRPYYPRIQTTSCCPPMIVIEQSTSKAH